MAITYKYHKNPLNGENCAIIFLNEEGTESTSAPIDPENTTYAEIMRQVEAGELTIEPADEL